MLYCKSLTLFKPYFPVFSSSRLVSKLASEQVCLCYETFRKSTERAPSFEYINSLAEIFLKVGDSPIVDWSNRLRMLIRRTLEREMVKVAQEF